MTTVVPTSGRSQHCQRQQQLQDCTDQPPTYSDAIQHIFTDQLPSYSEAVQQPKVTPNQQYQHQQHQQQAHFYSLAHTRQSEGQYAGARSDYPPPPPGYFPPTSRPNIPVTNAVPPRKCRKCHVGDLKESSPGWAGTLYLVCFSTVVLLPVACVFVFVSKSRCTHCGYSATKLGKWPVLGLTNFHYLGLSVTLTLGSMYSDTALENERCYL